MSCMVGENSAFIQIFIVVMMFNGLLMCTDSDSDFAKESICRSSGQESTSCGGSCASARASYFKNKLLATLQILQNKEDTVRVQAESLAVAESRITTLTTRYTDTRRELERKEREIQSLRNTLKECIIPCKVEKFNVSLTAEVAEMEDKENVVTTLQNNLGVIEDLYQECFFETVKQENLIEMLRKSNLDIRLMDKVKSDRIYKLHNVINTQKWSLDRCQDIATEVENLKVEISNFVNSSNNDSGVWEESVVSDLNEDLQDIAAQLLRLRELLTGECSCGLLEENRRLTHNNAMMEEEISILRSKVCALEEDLRNESTCLVNDYQEQIDKKERELSCVHEKLQSLMQNCNEKASCLDSMTAQMAQTKEVLDEKSTELKCMQEQCRIYDHTIRAMKEELDTTQQITTENTELRTELCSVSRRAARLQRRAQHLEAELHRAKAHAETIETAYRDKTLNAVELEQQLDAAHARGADLCAEASRVVRTVRGWAHRMKEVHREQEKQIKQKQYELNSLQQEKDKRKEMFPRAWEQLVHPCFPIASTSASGASEEATYSKCVTIVEGSHSERRDSGSTSVSDMASCSTPTPPPRMLKRTCLKRPGQVASSCGIRCRYGWKGPFCPVERDAGSQHPTRHSDSTCASNRRHSTAAPCLLSPGEEMFSRIENLSEALADGYKRWSRRTS